jgi:hypothetical protein
LRAYARRAVIPDVSKLAILEQKEVVLLRELLQLLACVNQDSQI